MCHVMIMFANWNQGRWLSLRLDVVVADGLGEQPVAGDHLCSTGEFSYCAAKVPKVAQQAANNRFVFRIVRIAL